MTSKGAKTGQDRTAIVTYHRDGDAFVIAATKGGADEHPQSSASMSTLSNDRIGATGA